MSANNSLDESIDNDSVRAINGDSKKIEILSIRIEFDCNLPYTTTVTQPYGFFQLNETLDDNTIHWLTDKIRSDITEDLDDIIFVLPHRYIITGDGDVFNFNGMYFDYIDLVFGQEKTYWRYSTKLDSGEIHVKGGETILEIGNCPCCINEQFRRVVSVLKMKCNM